ncbi:MAG: bifunctional riboflavin kinase/FAD synthetase [Herpetosiphonaceae bacterium]|nr:bifunctional riboflavin kinase/FAD synthetase [Herpetosiphonaceae bacterium]
MIVYRTLAQLHVTLPAALTIGVFDGVHRGHQYLLGKVVERAQALVGVSVALTFDPHPDIILHPERQHRYVCDLDRRIVLIEQLGIDHLVILPFDATFARQTAEQFMAQLCAHVQLRELWVGHDFRLGYRGLGTVELLASLGHELGYTVHPINAELIAGQPVSSTLIRQYLEAGNVVMAQQLLGHPFIIRGLVVHGDHRGRTIGFPTANLQTPPEQLLPANGVYACRVQLPGDATWLPAVTNVGVRPTFGVLNRTVEAHLLDWDGDLYDKTLNLQFVAHLRGEQKFSGIDALVTQIRADAAQSAQLLQADPTETTSMP